MSHRVAWLLATTALTAPLSTIPTVAQNLPTGASVAAGSVSIAQPSATQMTITQSSPSAVVNYGSFSIGAGSSVNIQQPSVNAALLNRVTGDTPSTIAGSLTANGQVYLVNPNGIAITRSGTVNVGGGFVASTLGISDSDFMSGKRTFSGNGTSAAVSNAGAIRVGRGGYAALIGGTVENSGSIEVSVGKVGLGAGERATLDFAGDGFLQVTTPTQSGGDGALIRHSGSIKANGGSVVISAATAREAARNAINLSGHVQARSISGRPGAITIGGGAGGAVKISGRLSTASRSQKGGSITVTGRNVAVQGATIDASGAKGGGSIRIGGDWQGKGDLQRADTTSIDAATVVRADATVSGNGGKVVVWSDLQTTFAGAISARGGAAGGNGGDAEVSGKATLAYSGTADLRAPAGSTGTLLLDPYNVTISSAADANQAGFTATGDNSVINVSTLQTALAMANVTVSTGAGGSQAGDIIVAAPITWSANNLTLSAHRSIWINANLNASGTGGLSLITNTGGTGGDYRFGAGASASFTGAPGAQALTINGAPYTLLHSLADLQAIDDSLPALQGRYALARSLDATGYVGWEPIARASALANLPGFEGSLTGLGHTISNLNIDIGNGDYAGLFAKASYGTIRDLGLVGGSVTGSNMVGSLVGQSSATISDTFATGSVNAGSNYAGGLVGRNSGSVLRSYATGNVTSGGGYVGGLVGFNARLISDSHATGNVSGWYRVGGLVGEQSGYFGEVNGVSVGGRTTASYATGTVSGETYIGGLVGYITGNRFILGYSVHQSYATGAVTGTGNALYVGGLVGYSAGEVAYSYATGTVKGDYKVGGLIGMNENGGMHDNFATGAVHGIGAVGGLIGENYGDTSNSYSTGAVTGTGNVGAVIGYYGSGRATSLHWDMETSGIAWAGNQGLTGLTTRQMQGLDPLADGSYFSASDLGGAFAGGTGLYPYLKDFFPGGVNVVQGFAYKADGSALASTSAGAANVSAISGGRVVGGATTGANGYYYVFLPAGTLTANAGVAVSTAANVALGADNAVSFASGATAANTRLDVTGGWRTDISAAATPGLTALDVAYGATIGATAPAGYVLPNRRINSVGSFTVDKALAASGKAVISSGADLTIAAAGSVTAGATGDAAVLAATGRFLNSSGAAAVSTANGRWLIYSDNPDANLFGSLDSGNTAIWNRAAFGAVSASGNRYVFARQPTLTFTSVDASKVYGTNGRTIVDSAWAVSGMASGVTNAFLADTAQTAFTGAPEVSSYGSTPYAWATSAADPAWDIEILGAGSLQSSSGYAFSFAGGGKLTIDRAALTITASDVSKVYGQTANMTFSASGLQNGESVRSVTLSSLGAAATAGVAGSPYAITASSNWIGLANYNVTYVGGQLTVTPAPLAITANATKTYGQTANLTFSANGLQNGETIGSVGLSSLGAGALAGVGTYGITVGAASGGTFNPANYTITYANGHLTVNPATLTITANTGSKVYGDADPALTFAVSGFMLSDTAASVLSGGLMRAAGESVGDYAIGQGSLASTANYTLSYRGASFSILPEPPSPTPAMSVVTAGRVVLDSFEPVSLPANARPVSGAPNLATPLGFGVFYADPRSETPFVCFGGGYGTAQACLPAGQ